MCRPAHHVQFAGMTDGFDDGTAYGFIDGFDDATMGWARYAQATKHMNLNSGLFYVRANANTLDLMVRLATRLSRQKYWDQTAFNEEIFFLSHGNVTRVPISVRVMDYWLFQNSKVLAGLPSTPASLLSTSPCSVGPPEDIDTWSLSAGSLP
jgi:hypothetical protein